MEMLLRRGDDAGLVASVKRHDQPTVGSGRGSPAWPAQRALQAHPGADLRCTGQSAPARDRDTVRAPILPEPGPVRVR